MDFWLLVLIGIGGLAALIGFLFRWWGLLASAGFACFLAYAWELEGEGLYYALIVGLVTSVGVAIGSLTRQSFRR